MSIFLFEIFQHSKTLKSFINKEFNEWNEYKQKISLDYLIEYKDKKSKNAKLLTNFYPIDDLQFFLGLNRDYFSVSKHSFSNILDCNETGSFTVLKTDRYGFINNDNLWSHQDLDFMIIGDSNAQGQCID